MKGWEFDICAVGVGGWSWGCFVYGKEALFSSLRARLRNCGMENERTSG